MCELRAVLAKTAMTFVDVVLFNYPRVQGVTFAVATAYALYFQLKLVSLGRAFGEEVHDHLSCITSSNQSMQKGM